MSTFLQSGDVTDHQHTKRTPVTTTRQEQLIVRLIYMVWISPLSEKIKSECVFPLMDVYYYIEICVQRNFVKFQVSSFFNGFREHRRGIRNISNIFINMV